MMREKVYSVFFTKTSGKQYKLLAKKVQREIALILEEIACYPLLGKALHSSLKGLRSKRVGKVRIIYKQEKKQLVVVIVNIEHRKSVYRKKQ